MSLLCFAWFIMTLLILHIIVSNARTIRIENRLRDAERDVKLFSDLRDAIKKCSVKEWGR